MLRLKTSAVESSLRTLIEERATAAAGSNRWISKDEGKSLDTFLRGQERSLRTSPGARVDVTALVGRAMKSATTTMNKVNPEGPSRPWLSKAELKALGAMDPGLGALTQLAVLRLQQPGNIGDAARSYFSGFDFKANEETGERPLHQALPGGTKIDARPMFPANRVGVPEGVLHAYDFFERAQEADWASVTLQKAPIGGFDAYVIYTATDGDDAYLEVLDKNGAPVVSGRVQAELLLGFDEVFGRDRYSTRMVALDEPAKADGLSEPAERLAAGQIPLDWAGDVTLNQGTLAYDSYANLGKIDVPALFSSPRAELGSAALEYLWQRSLRARVQGSTEPFLLGPSNEGSLVLGSFTRPSDGKVFEVADWRDIDDGSFTLYFDRTSEGRLRLAIEQFNN